MCLSGICLWLPLFYSLICISLLRVTISKLLQRKASIIVISAYLSINLFLDFSLFLILFHSHPVCLYFVSSYLLLPSLIVKFRETTSFLKLAPKYLLYYLFLFLKHLIFVLQFPFSISVVFFRNITLYDQGHVVII